MSYSAYSSFQFDTSGFDPEIWTALLTDWPFDSFHEEADSVTAYIPTASIDPDLIDYVNKNMGVFFVSYTLQEVPEVNWNETWEKSFQPVLVDKTFYVRAEFHTPGVPEEYLHEIIIAPKMAFGTGHHATTFMMLQGIHAIDVKGKEILDFGCGTGILGVAAILEGATHVSGIDIQPEAIENSIEHAEINNVSDLCQFIEGDISMLPNQTYDVILANITTPVILDSMGQFKESLSPNGYLLLSGILAERRDSIVESLIAHSFRLTEERTKDGWVQLTAIKE